MTNTIHRMKKAALLSATIMIFSCNNSRYIYIARHAEKSDSTITSGLSIAGHLRAFALKDRLISKKIGIIFATTIPATQETAQPLAGILHERISIYRYNAIDSIVTRLKEIKSKNILVVDHRGTIPAIIEGLTDRKIKPPEVSDYGNLYIIKIKKGKKGLTMRHYGLVTN
jgi:2,3-bisphosphoglycerate-dependent phosphoglycerate mutase